MTPLILALPVASRFSPVDASERAEEKKQEGTLGGGLTKEYFALSGVITDHV